MKKKWGIIDIDPLDHFPNGAFRGKFMAIFVFWGA